MRTDTLFYQIFQAFPQLVFLLLDRDVIPGYTFTSVEVKEKSFRFDGIFMPPSDKPTEPIYFIEVQFQSSANFYRALLSEIFLFLNQQQTDQDWVAVAIFPDRKVDTKNLSIAQQEMVNSGRIVKIYLDELPDRSPVELGLLTLITCSQDKAVEVVDQIRSVSRTKAILDFIETILVYKFPQMSREAIEKMFTLDDLRQTRVYQESLQEGIEQGLQQGMEQGLQQGMEQGLQQGMEQGLQQGMEQGLQQGRKQEAASLLLRLISRKFGSIPPDRVGQISTLPIDRLEELGEALFDFTTLDHLYTALDRFRV